MIHYVHFKFKDRKDEHQRYSSREVAISQAKGLMASNRAAWAAVTDENGTLVWKSAAEPPL